MARLSRRRKVILAALVVLLLVRVQPLAPHRAYENVQLTGRITQAIHLTAHPADRPFVMLGLSGGGVRAAALAYFVLQELAATQYTIAGQPYRLVDDIRVVSSVSGGSVTGAYFALHGPERLKRIHDAFLVRHNNLDLLRSALWPSSALRLSFSHYTRGALLADYLDTRLFEGATFTALRDPGRPALLLNATDIVDGSTFVFSPATFNALCADFDSFRIASAVAASAAFPLGFTPVTLKNYSGPGCAGWSRDENYVEHVGDNYVDRILQYHNSLYRGREARRRVDFVHLIDGGLGDNLALSPLEQLIRKPTVLGFPNYVDSLFPSRAATRPGLVVIAVNSRVSAKTTLDGRDRSPGIGSVIQSVIDLPMGSSSIRTQETVEGVVEQINAAYRHRMGDSDPRRNTAWFFRVDLDDLHGLCSASFIDQVNAIPTSWSITAEQLRLLEVAARRLIGQASASYVLAHDMRRPPLTNEDLAVCGRP